MRHSRTAALAAFASLFLVASAATPECLHTRSRELAIRASCGDEGSLNYCFSNLSLEALAAAPESVTSELERCFYNAGCTPSESQIEAFWALERCDENPTDLRRRRTGHEAAMPLAREAAPIPGITILARQGNPPAATNPPANQPAPAATNSRPASPSPCFTETKVEITSCPIQSTGADAGKKLSCFPTSVPTAVCREELICQVDRSGNPSCMYRESKPGLAGVIIAIFFASAVFVSVCGICFFCCRERREQRRLTRAAEAAKNAQEAKTQALINAKKSAAMDDGLDRQPLMAGPVGGNDPLPPLPQTQYNTGYSGAQSDAGYGGAHGQNPFADSQDGHPLR